MRNATTLLGVADADIRIAPTHWQRGAIPVQNSKPKSVSVTTASIPTHCAQKIQSSRMPKTSRHRSDRRRGPHLCRAKSGTLSRVRASSRELTRDPQRRVRMHRSASWAARGFHMARRLLPAAPEKGASQPDRQNVDFAPASIPWRAALPERTCRCWVSAPPRTLYLLYPFVLSWSLLEALAARRLRVVASDTARWPREVIRHGHNGIQTPFFDTAALAAED